MIPVMLLAKTFPSPVVVRKIEEVVGGVEQTLRVTYSDGSINEEIREYGFGFPDGNFIQNEGLYHSVKELMSVETDPVKVFTVIKTLTVLRDTKSVYNASVEDANKTSRKVIELRQEDYDDGCQWLYVTFNDGIVEEQKRMYIPLVYKDATDHQLDNQTHDLFLLLSEYKIDPDVIYRVIQRLSYIC